MVITDSGDGSFLIHASAYEFRLLRDMACAGMDGEQPWWKYLARDKTLCFGNDLYLEYVDKAEKIKALLLASDTVMV